MDSKPSLPTLLFCACALIGCADAGMAGGGDGGVGGGAGGGAGGGVGGGAGGGVGGGAGGGGGAAMDGGPTIDLDGGTTIDLDGGTTIDLDGGTTIDLDGGPATDLDGGTTIDLDGGPTIDLDGGHDGGSMPEDPGCAVLIDDLFDNGSLGTGGPTATNGGFSSYFSCGGAASESGGAMQIDVPVGLDCNAGGVSDAFVDSQTLDSGLTAYWDVAAAESSIPSKNYFVLQQRHGYSLGGESRPTLALSIRSDGVSAPTVELYASNEDGDFHTYYSSSAGTDLAELADGFRVWLTVHPTNGYAFHIEGLSASGEPITSSGAWVSTHDYVALFDTSSFGDKIRLAAYVWGDDTSAESADLSVDRMTMLAGQCP